MNLSESVYNISEEFMKDSKWVTINKNKLFDIADQMLLEGKVEFAPPKAPDIFVGIVYELVAASINYCYFYGKSTIRPNGASSTLMYNLMLKSFSSFDKSQESFSSCVDLLCTELSINRFPLLEERIRHLNELKKQGLSYCSMIENNYENNMFSYFSILLVTFPGFASDIFLKRASLFFMQLYRALGLFKEEMKVLHVPADYQLPKVLNYYNCISYHNKIKEAIEHDRLIQKGSIQECEIRSATILAMKELVRLTGWNIADVDSWFFTKKDTLKKDKYQAYDPKFHLTITTDY